MKSDFHISSYPAMNLNELSQCKVTILGTNQLALDYSIDRSGNLQIIFIPNMVYDLVSLKTIRIYLPDSFIRFEQIYKFFITLDGR